MKLKGVHCLFAQNIKSFVGSQDDKAGQLRAPCEIVRDRRYGENHTEPVTSLCIKFVIIVPSTIIIQP